MPSRYLSTAMKRAHYEILPDSGGYYGEIPDCPGVYATSASLEECREQLEEVLEEWVLLRVHRNLSLPVIDGVELAIREPT